jgi:hypothetical protein
MSHICTTCHGTGRIGSELKRSLKLKNHDLEILSELLVTLVDDENQLARELLDKLYRPEKL